MIKILSTMFERVFADNEARTAGFRELYKECIDTIPEKVRKILCGKVHPSPNRPSYSCDFTMADLLWWETCIKSETIFFYSTDYIRKQIQREMATAIESLNLLDAFDDTIRPVYEMLCKETGIDLSKKE